MRRIKGSERRRFRRRQLAVKNSVLARVCHSNGQIEPLKLAILDISEGGVRVQLASMLPDGEFKLAIDLESLDSTMTGELTLPCQSVWKRRVLGGKWVYGLEFVTSQVASELLTRVLKDLTSDKRALQEA